MMQGFTPPGFLDDAKVGTYSALAKAGGGFVWDEVLEYRVWCSPYEGAPDEDDGSDYYTPGVYEHRTDERVTEWPVAFLSRPRRTPMTLSTFFALEAPANRLDIIRGLGK